MNNLTSPMPKPVVTIHEILKSNYAPEINEKNKPELISTEQLYEAVYENAFHSMFIGDIEGKIIKFNEKFSLLFGFLPGEIEKLKSSDFFKATDNSFISFIQDRKEKGFAKAEIRGIRKSGQIFPCRISSVFYPSDKGEKRFMNTVVNISEHISARWNIAGQL